MKAFKKIAGISSMIIALMVVGSSVYAQEYDDLYFTPKDRKEIKYDGETVTKSDESSSTYESFTNNTYSDKYSSHNVNPDYIARYQSGSSIKSYNSDDNDNANYSQPSESTVEYYDEDNQYANDNTSGQTIINNNYYGNTNSFNDPYWGNNWNSWNNWNRWNRWNRWSRWNAWNDPFWGFNTGIYYDPFFGWGNSWSVSFGFGNRWGWGNPWNRYYMYDPFYSPFYAGGFYDPWFGGFGSPYRGWGWRNSYYNGYYNGFYNGYHNGLSYNDRNTRNVVVGARSSTRGGFVSNSPRTNSTTRSSIDGLSRRSDSRDFSGTQNEYFSRSRTSATSGRTVSSARTSTSGRSNSAATYDARSSRSSSADYSRSNTNSRSGRTYSTPSSTNTRSSGTTRRYNSSSYDSRSSSSSSGRSYSPNYSNSRSSSSSYRSNSYGSSSGRSSGSSYSSGSSSRSSGSSYSPSRSSGSSSGRSSGSSSSGRSGR